MASTRLSERHASTDKALAGQGNRELALEKCKLAAAKVDNCVELNALVADLKARLKE